MRNFLVPMGGLTAVVTLATVLIGFIVLRSPDTHANLWTTLEPGYARTSPIFVGQEVGDIGLLLNGHLKPEVFGFTDPGRVIYLTRGCSTCHGLDARGGPVGPSLAGSLPETVKRMVREGPGGMPAYSEVYVSDTDLTALATYLRSLEVIRPLSEQIAALQRLTYDPSVPIDVLLKGKAAIRTSCGACHTQPGKDDILRAFSNDTEAALLVADMVYETNLSLEDARAIAYYMLAILNDADPIKAP